MMLEYVKAKTYHVRKGEIKNSFSYGVDYVLLSDEQKNDVRGFSHNKINLFSIFELYLSIQKCLKGFKKKTTIKLFL